MAPRPRFAHSLRSRFGRSLSPGECFRGRIRRSRPTASATNSSPVAPGTTVFVGSPLRFASRERACAGQRVRPGLPYNNRFVRMALRATEQPYRWAARELHERA